MQKINCYTLILSLAFAEKVTAHLWTHYNKTGEETCKTIEENGTIGFYAANDYTLIMVKADKKNCFTVYGYREID